MKDSGRRLGRRIARVFGVVVIAAVFGGLLYLRTWPPVVVVMSSSMEPAIDTGAIVLVRHVDVPPEVGDVVKVPVPAAARELGYPKEVLHRVIEVTEDGLVKTQGDNLDDPDPFAVPVAMVSERVVTVIPGAGELVAFLFSPFGLMWMAAGLVLLVVMPFFDGQRELKLAVTEYGYHLKSHTQILQSMSAASQDLAATTELLRESLPGLGDQMPDARRQVSDSRNREPDEGRQTPDSRPRAPDTGRRIPDEGDGSADIESPDEIASVPPAVAPEQSAPATAHESDSEPDPAEPSPTPPESVEAVIEFPEWVVSAPRLDPPVPEPPAEPPPTPRISEAIEIPEWVVSSTGPPLPVVRRGAQLAMQIVSDLERDAATPATLDEIDIPEWLLPPSRGPFQRGSAQLAMRLDTDVDTEN